MILVNSLVYNVIKVVVDVIIKLFVKELGLCNICVNFINFGMVEIEGVCIVGIIESEGCW